MYGTRMIFADLIEIIWVIPILSKHKTNLPMPA